jgi:hypothetical protein
MGHAGAVLLQLFHLYTTGICSNKSLRLSRRVAAEQQVHTVSKSILHTRQYCAVTTEVVVN